MYVGLYPCMLVYFHLCWSLFVYFSHFLCMLVPVDMVFHAGGVRGRFWSLL